MDTIRTGLHLRGLPLDALLIDGSSASEESEQGSWRGINVPVGPTLEMVASSGQLLHKRLSRSDNDIYLTGTRVLVSSLAP
jgi:hypothetical protein